MASQGLCLLLLIVSKCEKSLGVKKGEIVYGEDILIDLACGCAGTNSKNCSVTVEVVEVVEIVENENDG